MCAFQLTPTTTRRTVLKIGAISPILLAGTFRETRAQSIRRGGVIRVALPPEQNLDPLRMQRPGAIATIQQVCENLAWAEPDLSLRPVLATGWQTSDGGRTWVFDIRQNVKFHNGQDLTADDVVASYQRMIDPATASAAAAQLPFLKKEGVSKTGPYQVQFILDSPVGQFPYYTTIYNAVILPGNYSGDFIASPIGTGPFKLVSYSPQESATLARNENYWDAGKPYLDGAEMKFFGSQQAMVLSLQSGNVDVLLRASYTDLLPLFNDPRFEIIGTPSATHRQLTMRVDREPFNDKRVRQAVAHCFNRPVLIDALLGGRATIGNDHPVAAIYPEKVQIQQRAEDVVEAKRLLGEAGYPQGFEVDLYTQQDLELPQYAQFIKQMLEPAGIRVNLNIEPSNVYNKHWTDVTFGLTNWSTRPTAIQILTTAFKGGAEWNAPRWQNSEFDSLLDNILEEVDDNARTKLLERAAAILHDEVPAVVIYFLDALRPIRKGVLGVKANMSNFLELKDGYLA